MSLAEFGHFYHAKRNNYTNKSPEWKNQEKICVITGSLASFLKPFQ
ncbi:hypothetical protein FLA_3825 [Filimonas lacunae]|nr:hypothetical protein FLA_3825 [Filimonas lacunae]